MSGLNTKDRPIEEKISKPAGRWRNWYLVKAPTTCMLTSVRHKPGETVGGYYTFPSKDLAETAMQNDGNNAARRGKADYLGAFPEGQDAP